MKQPRKSGPPETKTPAGAAAGARDRGQSRSGAQAEDYTTALAHASPCTEHQAQRRVFTVGRDWLVLAFRSISRGLK